MKIRVPLFAAGLTLFLAAPETPSWATGNLPAALQNRQRQPPSEQNRDRDQGPERSERVERTFQVGANGELELSNLSGRIELTGQGDRDIRLVAVKRVRASDDAEAARALAAVQLDIVQRGSRVEVSTAHDRERRRASVDFTVTVPVTARVRLHSISGDIRVANVNGELQVQSVSGDVAVRSASRVGSVKSVSGDLELDSIGTDGEIALGTVSGDIAARTLKVRALDLQTVSGDMVLDAVTAARAIVRSVSGDIEYAGELERNGRYEFTLHSGNLRLTPNQTGFELRATSFSGRIQSDLPLTIQPTGSAQDTRYGPRERTIRGVYGDGGAFIEVTTFSGNVSIGPRR